MAGGADFCAFAFIFVARARFSLFPILTMPRYFIHFLASVVLLAGAMAGFNWWVDPYAICRDRELSLQQQQPILVMNERVFKTVGVARAKADVVILGTSRTDIGIGSEHQAFPSKRVFNLATFRSEEHASA